MHNLAMPVRNAGPESILANDSRKRSPFRIAFVTNFCPHYRVKTFEILASRVDTDFIFFSDGSEWYGQRSRGMHTGKFRHQYLRGFHIFGTRITPGLIGRLLSGNYDALVAGIDGRFAPLVAYAVARLTRRPFVLWTGIWSRIHTPFHRLAFPITKHIYRNADAIVAYGEHVRRYLVEMGISERKIFVAPHAVDNGDYCRAISTSDVRQLRGTLGVTAKLRILLYVGRLEAAKGLVYVIDSLRQVSLGDWVLVIVGEGSQRIVLEKRARELGLSAQIRFVGSVTPEQTVAYYSLAHVLLLPSIETPREKEPWGLVVNEAMNQGVPIIATDAVGAAAGGLVRDGVNGYIVPERDSSALALAIRKILETPGWRDELGENARRSIASWDNERMVDGFEEAIDWALSGRSVLDPDPA